MFTEKFIKQWVLPPEVFRFFSHLYLDSKKKISVDDKKILSKNFSLKDKYKGKRCFIIGNGPSINKQDLTLISNDEKIVMNKFFYHPILETWKPTFYCAADPSSSYPPEYIKILKEAQGKLSAEGYMVPIENKSLIENNSVFPQEKTYYFRVRGGYGSNWDLTDTLCSDIQTTTHFAIILAIYLGCSPIYLIGMDHDWLAHRSVEKHFYPSDNVEKGSPSDLSTTDYKTMMEIILRVWKIYDEINKFAEEKHTPIYNATEGGFLDVFPRVEYDTLF